MGLIPLITIACSLLMEQIYELCSTVKYPRTPAAVTAHQILKWIGYRLTKFVPRTFHMKLDTSTTKKLAELAKLEFNNEELDEIQRDLEQMIGFVEKLNEIDTAHVEPLTHVSEGGMPLREDEVKGSIDIATALKNAPASTDRFFTVPKVIKK